MQCFLRGSVSRRFGFDGWAIRHKGVSHPMPWTACTTREEARNLLKTEFPNFDILSNYEIIKIKIEVKPA